MRLETDEAFRRYADRVYASAFSITRDPKDADDATRDTFLRYHTRNDDFESEAHLKAWLLRVAINRAKDLFFTAAVDSVDEALKLAEKMTGADATVALMPTGSLTVPLC